MKPRKTGMIRLRCEPTLKHKVTQIAMFKGLDAADIIRIAINDYIRKFEAAEV